MTVVNIPLGNIYVHELSCLDLKCCKFKTTQPAVWGSDPDWTYMQGCSLKVLIDIIYIYIYRQAIMLPLPCLISYIILSIFQSGQNLFIIFREAFKISTDLITCSADYNQMVKMCQQILVCTGFTVKISCCQQHKGQTVNTYFICSREESWIVFVPDQLRSGSTFSRTW
jgi:hypothetical protein